MEEEENNCAEKHVENKNILMKIDSNEVVDFVEEEQSILNLTDHIIKQDQFDGIHILDERFKKVEGAPNFRQIEDFLVYGTGQPTKEAMMEIINLAVTGTSTRRLIWFNMRQEPVVYVNGLPFAPRCLGNPHMNLEDKLDPENIKAVEAHLDKVLKKRFKEGDDGTIMFHKDKAFAENPMEREDMEVAIEVESIESFESVFNFCREKSKAELKMVYVPVIEEQMTSTASYDIIVEALKDEKASVPCVFSCQMGKGRTTIGMISACLIKQVQLTTELKELEKIGLIDSKTMRDLLYQKFEHMPHVSDEEVDPLTRGEFKVVQELHTAIPATTEAKRKLDIVIDKCGVPPQGVGIQNLRECIMGTKYKYDVEPEEKQDVYKQRIMNFIERYFYLICFSHYCLEFGPDDYKPSFTSWMEEHQEIIKLGREGRGKIEWSRTVDESKLQKLKEMMMDPDFKANLGPIIKTIYEFAFLTYSDLPKGKIKTNCMRKLATTTLMEIISPDMAEKINKKIEEDKTVSHDFLTIVGMISQDDLE